MRSVQRVMAGLSMCIAVLGLSLLVSTAAASPAGVWAAAASTGPVKHCPGAVSASRYGVTLTASRVNVTATKYGSRSAHRVWPRMTCTHVRDVIHAFLRAKLYRPLNQCTVPELKGYWCRVKHWLCAVTNPAAQSPTPEQQCVHDVIDRAGALRRITHIFFRETDRD